jgi:hypothetical protein
MSVRSREKWGMVGSIAIGPDGAPADTIHHIRKPKYTLFL